MEITYVDIIVFLTAFLAVLYYYGMKPFKHFVNTDVKFIQPKYPLLGSLDKLVFKSVHIYKFIDDMYRKYPDEKYIGIFEGTRPLVFVRDLDLIKQIGIKDFDYFHDHRRVINVEEDLLTDVLFNMQGEKWKEMRAALSPMFTSSKMKNMFPIINDYAKEFSEYFADDKNTNENGLVDVELNDALTRYTNDIIATSVFGSKVNSLKEKENIFYKMGKLATDFSGLQLLKFMGYFVCSKVMNVLQIRLTRPSVNNFFTKIIIDGIENREKTGMIRQDMIHMLMLAKRGSLEQEKENGDLKETGFSTVEESSIGKRQIKRKWTECELVAQAFMFFIAGFSTTSGALFFYIYEMIRNPDIQKKVQKEIDDILAESNGKLTYSDIPKFKYMDMTISETLRMWPQQPHMDRVCDKTYKLPPPNENSKNSYEIQKGDTIWIPSYSLMHDSKYFPDPEKFDPERFSEENKHLINPSAYIPFGIGPRNCIGSRFALLEMKLLIFHILSRFDVVETEKSDIPVKLNMGMAMIIPTNGLWVGLKRRKT